MQCRQGFQRSVKIPLSPQIIDFHLLMIVFRQSVTKVVTVLNISIWKLNTLLQKSTPPKTDGLCGFDTITMVLLNIHSFIKK